MEKKKVSIERRNIIKIADEEEESSSSLTSMYSLDLDKEDSHVPSHRSPTVVLHDASLPMHLEEFHSSSVTEKISFERHLVINEEDHPPIYSIEEIFDAFTFNLCKLEVSRKRVQSVKPNDGSMKVVQKDEFLFKKTNEDPVSVATTSTTLTQATTHNVTMMNDKNLQTESKNIKLKDEIASLR